MFIVDGLRTPRAAVRGGRGALSEITPLGLLTALTSALQARVALDPVWVQQVVVGCVTQVGDQGGNIAARAVAASGWTGAATAETINRFCASGLAAVNTLAARIHSGEVGLGVAGGVESMSRVPMGSDRLETGGAGLEPIPTGVAADLLAAANCISRAELDDYAAATQRRAQAALDQGRLQRSLVPIGGFDRDDAVRQESSAERLATLPTVFGPSQLSGVMDRATARWPGIGLVPPVHTAGTAPAMADGAGLLVLADQGALDRYGLAPRARIVATASAAVDSVAGPTAAIEAAQVALKSAGLSVADLDLAECHEAFAVTPILFGRDLGLDADRVNCNGGTIALGHPMGACGAILTITLLDELERRGGRYGLVAISGAAAWGPRPSSNWCERDAMKLVRFGEKGHERPGLIDASGQARDLSSVIADLGPDELSPAGLRQLGAVDVDALPAVAAGTRLGVPVSGCRNFYAVGFNYRTHVAEAEQEIPAEPQVFNKATSCLSGPNDPVVIPRGSRRSDWEVELALVIGTGGHNISADDALAHVAGYTIVNDMSERRWQVKRGGQWIKGKSAPTFGPIGPWLVTTDEVPDPQALDLWLALNGTRVQNSNTSEMIFGCAFIVSYLSEFLELLPGDVITTGTPDGIGMSMQPPRFLAPGDRMTLSVAGLGEQSYPVVAHPDDVAPSGA